MMPRRSWLGLALIALVGCGPHDAECLTRLGRTLAERSRSATKEVRDRLDLPATEVPMRERVARRLQSDKLLAETAVTVTGDGAEVALQGTVKTREQRQRAVELAETTVGVERLSDTLQISEP